MVTLVKWIILLPVLMGVLLLAIANDQSVTIHLNPFDTQDPVLRADMPVYQFGFLAFVVGALVGGLIAWSGQHRYRKRARHRAADAPPWQADTHRTHAAPPDAVSPSAAFLPRPERM